jgi:hypothetical protein
MQKMKTNFYMKKTIALFIMTLLFNYSFGDVAPNPIVIKGICTVESCKIRMISETVVADLHNDSAKVECTFELQNYSDSTTIEVGFPEMNFQYLSIGEYEMTDKRNFKICVDDEVLTDKQIGVPKEMDSIYNACMAVYSNNKTREQKTDSIYKTNNVTVNRKGETTYRSANSYNKTTLALDSLKKTTDFESFFLSSELMKKFDSEIQKGNYPWYVWNVHFERNETKTVKVVYSLPSGLGYGKSNRYFKYLLHTGSGWYQDIERADVILKLHGIKTQNIEEITPKGYIIDDSNKTITWNFKNIEPTEKDDIFVRYFNSKERNAWKRH